MSLVVKMTALANDVVHRAQAMAQGKFNMGPTTFEKSGYGIQSNKVFQSNEFSRFQSANKDLLHVISKSDKAKEIYSKKEIRTRDDLVQVIAQAAHDQLSGESKDVLTTDKLAQNPQVASLIALNSGGLRDVVNESKANAEMVMDTSADFKKDTIERVAEKAASRFEPGNALNDKQFFQDHPKAAVYALTNADVVRDFTETQAGKDRAKVFRDEVNRGVNQDLLENETNNFIQNTFKSGTYNEDFLNANPDFTNYLAASMVLDDQPTVSKVLKHNPQYNLRNRAVGDRFNYDDVTRDIMAQQAFEKIRPDSELTENDFKTHSGLARLILKNVSLQDEFRKDDVQKDLGVIFGNERPKIETPIDVLQNQFHTALKERTLVSVIA